MPSNIAKSNAINQNTQNKTKPRVKTITFEDAVLSLNIISPSQLELAKIESANSGRQINTVLREMNLITEESEARAWGVVYGLPYVNLQGQTIDQEMLHQVPEQVAKNYGIIAFGKINNDIKVAISDPRNLQALEVLDFIKKRNENEFELYIASQSSVDYGLSQYGTLTVEVKKTLKEIAPDEFNLALEQAEDVVSKADLEKSIQEAPISKVVAILIKYAISARASDIHIEPQEREVKVRYRIDGVLHEMLQLPKGVQYAVVSRIKIMSNLKIDETRVPQDGRFGTELGDKAIDFRVSTFPTANGEKIVMRILDKSSGIMTLKDLGLYDDHFKILLAEISKPYGMLLVTGPTGSGKSTTLYASLSILNKEDVNIVTIEDPIEYFLPGVNQSQTKAEIGYTFAGALRTMLRQDPDIILVGEIRDNETAEMAIHSALTGHMVFSTLHTNDSAGAIPRMIDMGVEPFLIVSSANLVMAQRLVRKICSNCKSEREATKEEQRQIAEELGKVTNKEFKEKYEKFGKKIYEGKGCVKCNNIGYLGRMGIFELLPVTEKIEELSVKRVPASDLRDQAIKEGMLTMKQDGMRKVLEGETTLKEVLRVTAE